MIDFDLNSMFISKSNLIDMSYIFKKFENIA